MSRTDFSFAQRGHTVTTKGPEPGPILLTKLQPDIRILASHHHHHHHHHYHLPTTPPLPPFSLPPSLISPTAPFPLHSCQSYCTAARPNTTPDLLAWAEPAALACQCSHCVSSAPYLGLAEPKKRTSLDTSSTSFAGATKIFATVGIALKFTQPPCLADCNYCVR